jgi:hypothetical protein
MIVFHKLIEGPFIERLRLKIHRLQGSMAAAATPGSALFIGRNSVYCSTGAAGYVIGRHGLSPFGCYIDNSINISYPRPKADFKLILYSSKQPCGRVVKSGAIQTPLPRKLRLVVGK